MRGKSSKIIIIPSTIYYHFVTNNWLTKYFIRFQRELCSCFCYLYIMYLNIGNDETDHNSNIIINTWKIVTYFINFNLYKFFFYHTKYYYNYSF